MLSSKNTSMRVAEAKERLRMLSSEGVPWLALLQSTTREHIKASLFAAFSTGLVLGSSSAARESVRNLVILCLKNICLVHSQEDEDPGEN